VTHLRAYQQIAAAKIVAVCDPVRLPVNGVLQGLAGNIKKSDDVNLGLQVKVFRKLGDVLAQSEVDLVDLCTPTPLHAEQAIAALTAGKHVFCEKPLALREEELAEVEKAWKQAAGRPPCLLMVGFNRRFAPLTVPLRTMIAESGEPPVLILRVNAGPLPRSHWTQDPEQGGGRILGEACHFVDLLSFLAGALPARMYAAGAPAFGVDTEDNFAATIEFANGAVGSLVYTSSGDRAFPKERIEAFCGERVAVLDDFRSLEIWRAGNKRVWNSPLGQDKGHKAVWEAFIRSLQEGAPPPIAPAEIFAVTRATFALLRAVRGKSVEELAVK